MAGKTLSNGTLSLRFMQNASRAKQLATAELEQAKIKDEAEWEVPAAVRASWGPLPSESAAHETSYIPFMFDNEAADASGSASSSAQRWRGRRAFDGKGREIIIEQKPLEEEGSQDATERKDWSKGQRRPATISGSTGTLFVDRKDKSTTKTTGKSRTGITSTSFSAQLSIRDGGSVGSDLRTARAARTTSTSGSASRETLRARQADDSDDTQQRAVAFLNSTGFMKPAGVDAPATSAKRPSGGVLDDSEGKKKRKKKKELEE